MRPSYQAVMHHKSPNVLVTACAPHVRNHAHLQDAVLVTMSLEAEKIASVGALWVQ